MTCPPQAIPAPGQYLMAWVEEAPHYELAASLYAASTSAGGFRAALPGPLMQPGLNLHLRGPLGHGFRPVEGLRRLALAAFDCYPSRLMPLAESALRRGADVALFTNAAIPRLPASFEQYPLDSLPEILSWADFLAIDTPLEGLGRLRSTLGLEPGAYLPCPAQVLIFTPMPCGGLAECGACAVMAPRGWKLACKDGPVFDLHELNW